MQLSECAPQAFDAPGSRLEHEHRFGFVGDFAFPPVERSRSRVDRSAGNQSAVEQSSHQLDRLGFVGDRGKDYYCISVGHLTTKIRFGRGRVTKNLRLRTCSQ